MPVEKRFPDYLSVLERVASLMAIVRLQLVGIMSNTVLHHVLHALPIALLLFVMRSRALHPTAPLKAVAATVAAPMGYFS